MELSFPKTDLDLKNYPNKGLTQLSFLQKIKYYFCVRDFKKRVNGQPDFFISNDDWRLLSSGQSIDGSGRKFTWLKPECDVFGFALSFLFTDFDFNTCKSLSHEKSNRGIQKLGYIRIRTIFRKRKDDTNLYVDTENIAYLDLETAVINHESSDTLTSCLRFLTQISDTKERDKVASKIRDEVYSSNPKNLPKSNTKIPDKLLKDKKAAIKNEGMIIFKSRIVDEIIEKYKGHSEGSFIKFTWNEKEKQINYLFSVNPEYISDLPCPNPPICGNP